MIEKIKESILSLVDNRDNEDIIYDKIINQFMSLKGWGRFLINQSYEPDKTYEILNREDLKLKLDKIYISNYDYYDYVTLTIHFFTSKDEYLKHCIWFDLRNLEPYFAVLEGNIKFKDIKEAVNTIERENLILQENLFILNHTFTTNEYICRVVSCNGEYLALCASSEVLSLDNYYNKELLRDIVRIKDIIEEKKDFIKKYLPYWLQLKKHGWKDFVWEKSNKSRSKEQISDYCSVNEVYENGLIQLVLREGIGGLKIYLEEL